MTTCWHKKRRNIRRADGSSRGLRAHVPHMTWARLPSMLRPLLRLSHTCALGMRSKQDAFAYAEEKPALHTRGIAVSAKK